MNRRTPTCLIADPVDAGRGIVRVLPCSRVRLGGRRAAAVSHRGTGIGRDPEGPAEVEDIVLFLQALSDAPHAP